MNKLLKWFLSFFKLPELTREPRRVKFVEGTEWTCPACGTVLGVARRDIYSDEVMFSSAWRSKSEGFWTFKHCGVPAVCVSNGRSFLHTPTGWVG